MHAIVVFESIWGNTEQLAREVAAGIGGERTEVVDVASAPAALDSDVDLVVVGGPTHAFSMSTASTREAAKQQGAERIPTRGIREWWRRSRHRVARCPWPRSTRELSARDCPARPRRSR